MKEITKEQLEDLYINQRKSTRSVAKELEIGQTSVRRLMQKYNIPARTGKDAKNIPEYQQLLLELSERYRKEYTQTHIMTCQCCHKEFTITGLGGKWKLVKYCSDECKQAAKKENPVKIRRHREAKKQYCELCGEEIIFKEGTQRCKRKFCNKCAEENPSLTHRRFRIVVNCGYCGKEMEIIESRYKSNEKNYCCVQCMAMDYKLRFSGENSPSYKGGDTHHYQGHWLNQRKLAIERDNHCCQLCGITEEEYGKGLSVHHIINYREFQDKEEANQLDNLISLCEPCHRFIHSNQNVDKYLIKTLSDKEDIV